MEKVCVDHNVTIFNLEAGQEAGIIQGSEGCVNTDVVEERNTFFEVVWCVFSHISTKIRIRGENRSFNSERTPTIQTGLKGNLQAEIKKESVSKVKIQTLLSGT